MAAKVMTVVGGRPQFIKAATVTHVLEKRNDLNEYMVHTGQHFDHNMSELFFDQLGIPEPKVNLGVSGGSHAEMTGRMMMSLEEVMVEQAPDSVVVYGDMNSTLAGALAAVKLHIPICHVEAGGRTFHLTNPEEANRVCVDHIASTNCAVTLDDLSNLKREGLAERSRYTGDTMLDAFLWCKDVAPSIDALLLEGLDGEEHAIPQRYVLLTCHRAENTDNAKLRELFLAVEELDCPVVYPVHPRVQPMVRALASEMGIRNAVLLKPVGYLESVALTNGAEKVLTDSGGLQREAFFAGKKCVTLMDFPVIPQTMVGGRNELAPMEHKSIIEALSHTQLIDESYHPFGDGTAAKLTVDAIEECLEVR